jgi:hypothetical protein
MTGVVAFFIIESILIIAEIDNNFYFEINISRIDVKNFFLPGYSRKYDIKEIKKVELVDRRYATKGIKIYTGQTKVFGVNLSMDDKDEIFDYFKYNGVKIKR